MRERARTQVTPTQDAEEDLRNESMVAASSAAAGLVRSAAGVKHRGRGGGWGGGGF